MKVRETPFKTENTTLFSLYKGTTSSKAKRDIETMHRDKRDTNMRRHPGALCGPASLTINEKVMMNIVRSTKGQFPVL